MRIKVKSGVIVLALLLVFAAGNNGVPGCHGPCYESGDCATADQYCWHRTGKCESRGGCFDRPEACPEYLDPVCGCDGVTYDNPCFAAMAGVSVDYYGECEPVGCYSDDECLMSGTERMYCHFLDGECEGPGECEYRPDACPHVWDPVCGCDGLTYSNSCFAAMAGVSVAYEGECEVTECYGDEDCMSSYSDQMYCHYPDGVCEGPGECEIKPDICPKYYYPVCGCDGVTYGNPCEAAAAGVSIDYYGECEVTGCYSDEECLSPSTDRMYCHFRDGACEGPGECEERPLYCPEYYYPVCGCDGETYDNPCFAAAAGVSIDYYGQCEPDACYSDEDCLSSSWSDRMYCHYPDGICEGPGECEERPEICPMYYSPVCGCDGETYDNPCFAAAAGVSVDYAGECEPAGCYSDEECLSPSGTDRMYCQFRDGACEGPGECAERPEICPDVWDPVCGCDGETYSNRCYAARAGVSIDHEGPCEVTVCEVDEDCTSSIAEPMYCHYPDGECAAPGVCEAMPEMCPLYWAPVCGCDGETYGNPCFAAAAGVSIAYAGECEPGECYEDSECKDGDFCQFTIGECVGPGKCTWMPEACTMIYDPVCGCDGETHGNPCLAASVGVSVDYEGECAAVE